MKIDNTDFNEKYYASFSEEDFIKDLLPSVPSVYGDEKNKVAFLKSAYALIQKANPKKVAEKKK